MSGRGRLPPPHAMKGPPFPHSPPFAAHRGPHPDLLRDDMRGGRDFSPPRRGPAFPPHHHAALIDDRLAAQHQEIQTLLVDNQHLAATHVALRQELAAVQQELRRTTHDIAAAQAEKDARFRETYERSMKMEKDMRVAEGWHAELMQTHLDIQSMNAERQELTAQIQSLTHELSRSASDVQQAPTIKQEIEAMKQEIEHARGPAFPPHHHAALIDGHLAAQHQEIQTLLVDNQHLAATHVALRQELAAVQQELRRTTHDIAVAQAEKDARFRETYERSMKMEKDMRVAEGWHAELMQTHLDIQSMNAERQELTAQIQSLTHELSRSASDVQPAPTIKQEIEAMKQEIEHARACIQHEKKGYADSYEQGQAMQKNLVSMAREVEKLRAEVANTDKRARAAAAAGNQAAPYGGNYGNPVPDPGYGGNPYPAGYGMNPVPGGADGGVQYGSGPGSGSGVQYGSGPGSGSAPGSWGAYDVQYAHGRR